jgi:hypothetical protein
MGSFMHEMDILDYFYDELRARGQTRNTLFISLDDQAAAQLSEKLGVPVSIGELHKYADICIANEWLERTTADVEYKYLSLTEAGLQMAITYQYTAREKNK